jgi:protein PsiE|tara:strand:- start:501 stop:908 length:408 start_codon:yes stop_codon:yes gene_type:complete
MIKFIKGIVKNEFTKQLHWTTVVSEKGMLAVIGCLTLVAAGLDIWDMFLARNVDLADLFLLFIYVEIIGMVGAYYSTHIIPVTFPIVIAITAMCRLLILQGKESEPWVLISSAGAIIILAGAVYILNVGKKELNN